MKDLSYFQENMSKSYIKKELLGYEDSKKHGSWNDFSKVESELQDFISQLGHFPVQKEFAKYRRWGLLAAIQQRYGGLIYIREKLGYELNRKPNGYWTKENTIKELNKVIEKDGTFPTQERLKELKLSALTFGINLNGGMYEFRRLLGFEDDAKSKPQDYWTKENTLKEYKRLSEELGKAPSSKYLVEHGYAGLSWVISHKYGGFPKVRKEIGISDLRNKSGYWNKKKVLEACSKLIKEKGDLPGTLELRELSKESLEFSGLHMAIGNVGLTQREIRKKFGLEEICKPEGYWDDEKVETTAKDLVKELGYLPSFKELFKLGYGDLCGGITQKYGGMQKLRRKLNLDQERIDDWTEEKILEECKKIIHLVGDLPSNKKLIDKGYTALAAQIGRKGGFVYFRNLLNLKQALKPAGYWANEENVLAELKKLMAERNFNELPSQTKLCEWGHSSLTMAIQKYHGGLNEFRRKLIGLGILEDPKKTLQDKINCTNIKTELLRA